MYLKNNNNNVDDINNRETKKIKIGQAFGDLERKILRSLRDNQLRTIQKQVKQKRKGAPQDLRHLLEIFAIIGRLRLHY